METIPQPIPSSPTPNSKLPLILIGLVFLIILSVTGGFFLGNQLLQNFDGSKPRQETASDFQLALFVSKDDGTSLENYPKQWEGEFGKLQTETITIGGIKAIKGFSGQKYRVVPTVWFTLTNILYTIQLSNPNSTNKSWFDQIL